MVTVLRETNSLEWPLSRINKGASRSLRWRRRLEGIADVDDRSLYEVFCLTTLNECQLIINMLIPKAHDRLI